MSDQFPPAGEPVPPSGEPVPPTPPPTPPAGAVPPPPPPPPPAAAGAVPPAAAPGHAAPASDPASGPWTVGNAFSYGWKKFVEYIGPILIAIIVLFIGGLVVSVVWLLITNGIQNAIFGTPHITIDPTTGAISTSGGAGFFGTLVFGALGALVYFTIFGFIQAAITRAALAITEGKKIETSTLLSTDRLGEVILTAFLVGVFTAIGYLFCFVGAIVVEFFLFFVWYFLLDKGLAPMEAIKASFNFVKERVGDLIVFLLASWLAFIVGALLCGIGLLVAAPVVVIATAYTYKKFTDQAVAA
jgi:uncharacterized membrane protein